VPSFHKRATPELLRRRGALLRWIRLFFHEQGFLEVETPILARHAGMEPQLDPFVSSFRLTASSPGQPVYLLTSPEYAMKRLLVDGFDRLFQLSKVFRNGELGPMHTPEFTMLEWYRTSSSYLEIQADVEQLILFLAHKLGLGPSLSWQGGTIDLNPPWPRLTVRDAFLNLAHVDLAKATGADTLREAGQARGLIIPRDADWEECFFRILLELIEPTLGQDKPVFLTDYPVAFAALAKVRQEAFPVAERFELYIRGIEVGNAYSELTDPKVQAARFRKEAHERRVQGLMALEPDPTYLETLECGLPPTGGIAIGVDRLCMLLLDQPCIQQVMAFPFE